jgi:hypothetical protein
MPLATAIVYTALFAIAFWFYNVVWNDAPFVTPDSAGYIKVAQDLSDFRVDQLHARPPGYPILLVFTGTERRLFNTSLALHFSSIWLLSAVLYSIGLTRAWLLLFALLLLLPPYVEYAAYVLSDNLSEFLLVVSFSSLVLWFLDRGKSGLLMLSAVAIACSGLTRPTYQVLAIVVAGFLLIYRVIFGAEVYSNRSWIKAGIVLLAVSAILIGGYSLMNYVKFNFFGTYPISGFNFANRTVRVLERLPDRYMEEREALIKARDAQLVQRDGDHTGHDYFWHALPDLVKITGLEPIPDLSQHLLRLQLILIRKAPLHFLQEVFAAFSGYWLPSATKRADMNVPGMQVIWVILHFGVLALFVLQLFVITGLAMFQMTHSLFVGHDSTSLTSDHLFVYFLANTFIFFNAAVSSIAGASDARYRIPTDALIALVCFLGLFIWREQLFRISSR